MSVVRVQNELVWCIIVDLDASLAFGIYSNALTMLETRLGRREDTELARCQLKYLKRTCVDPTLNFDRDAHDSS